MARRRRIVLCDCDERRLGDLRRFLQVDPEIEVAASFTSLAAMESQLATLAADLVVVELEAAGREAGEAVARVLGEAPAPLVVLYGTGDAGDERLAAALEAGAREAIETERLKLDRDDEVWASAMRGRFKRLASQRPRGPNGEPTQQAPRRLPWRKPGSGYRAIGIGASVGGPPALVGVLGRLPADFPLPVLVVQHTAPGSAAGLANWLDRTVAIPVAIALDGARLEPGAWIAPDGAHLKVDRRLRLSLDGETDRGPHRPSLDVLLESLADSLGEEAVGVVLTGMGRDGAAGVRTLAAAGGLTIAQDESTSAVFGMPAAAAEAGAELVLPLDELAARLAVLRASRSGR